MSQQTRVNGNRYSFTSISTSLAGYDPPKGVIKAINYDGTKEPGVVQGNAVEVVGLTSGYGVGNGSLELLASEADDFISNLTNNGAVPVMDVDFDIVVSYAENDVDVRTDTLRGCRVTKVGSPNQQGTDGTTKTFELFIRRLKLNGIDLYADPAQ